MKRLYTPEEALHWRRRMRGSLVFCIVLTVLALAVCVLLCTQVGTANASRLLLTNVILFTLAGWADILILYYVYAPARALSVHMDGILAETPQVHEGVYTLKPGSFRIPGSITVRNAAVEAEDGAHSLHVSAALVRQLPDSGTRLRVWTVRRFIIAYEVIE